MKKKKEKILYKTSKKTPLGGDEHIKSKPSSSGDTERSDVAGLENDDSHDSGQNDLEQIDERTSSLGKEISDLKKLNESTKEEVLQNRDLLLRKTADFENYKKRILKDIVTSKELAIAEVIKNFLPVLDNLERAIQSASSPENGNNVSSLLDGVQMTKDQFKCILNNSGIKEIETIGKKFDPSLHEAVQIVPTSKSPENTIIEEYEKGYILNSRVIRPPKVVVSKNDDKSDNEDQPESDTVNN